MSSTLPTVPDDDPDTAASRLFMVKNLIFPKLSLQYGQRLALMYEGLDQEVVMQDWANELADVNMEGVTYALKHLPATDFPPNVGQFRRICGERPAPTPALPKQAALIRPGDGSRIPVHVREFTEAIHGQEKAGEEPRNVRVARQFVSRYGNPGQVLSQIQREWLPRMRQVVERFDRTHSEDPTKQLQAQTAERVAAYLQEDDDATTHG